MYCTLEVMYCMLFLNWHKKNDQMRPVVLNVNASAYKLLNILNNILPPLIDFKNTYSIRNAIELVTRTILFHSGFDLQNILANT